MQGKRPGLDMLQNTVDMVFDYKTAYSSYTPEAYETLLLDVMIGDQTLFMRSAILLSDLMQFLKNVSSEWFLKP